MTRALPKEIVALQAFDAEHRERMTVLREAKVLSWAGAKDYRKLIVKRRKLRAAISARLAKSFG
jgi:hypothetical protein